MAGEGTVERFRLSAVRERWLEFLAFDHPVLPSPLDFDREGEDFLVVRAGLPRRRIRDGRVLDAYVPALFLQAAALVAALEDSGFWASPDDLLEAGWELAAGNVRLVLGRTPAGLFPSRPVPACVTLAHFLDRIARRSGRIREAGAAQIRVSLATEDARRRRADYWVAAAYGRWPSLAAEALSPTRLRTLGSTGLSAADIDARVRVEKARALLSNRKPQVFAPASDCLLPGEAIGFAGGSLREAARGLRETGPQSVGSGSDGARPLWICARAAHWDALSRAALAAAALPRDGAAAADVLWVPDSVPPPRRADEWRAEISISCGTVRASLRFHERIAEVAASGSLEGRQTASRMVAHTSWAAYVADATGDAPLPPLDPERRTSRLGRRRSKAAASVPIPTPTGLARFEAGPEEDLRRALEGADVSAALSAAERWRENEQGRLPERWFELSARLAALVPASGRPAWLEALEAERELAGGRLAGAEACLSRILEDPACEPEQRRAAALRRAEVAVARGRAGEAARAAASWRKQHPDASAAELVRALELESAGASRAGEFESALERLDEADGHAAKLAPAVRVGLLLARAAVFSRAGRFDQERLCYESAREALAEAPDEGLEARVLGREALGLADRRDFDAAVVRLEEARRVLREDPVESARLAIDLAATLYHAGRGDRCRGLLEEAASLAGAAGREDLARIARGNLVEAAIASEHWTAASAELEDLLASARRDGDSTWTLVGLHHRSRLALRQGRLADARRDNLEARALASALGDRLEIGELWLEDGDRAALEGDAASARESYRRAAEDPPDRCDTDARARERLRELEAWLPDGAEGAVGQLARELSAALACGDYAAAEAVARGGGLAPARVPPELRAAAVTLLRGRGGAALARACLPGEPGSNEFDHGALRSLRDAVAAALAGEDHAERLPLGLAGLALADSGGEEVLRIGLCAGDEHASNDLHAGAERWTLSLWPPLPEADAEAVALVLETLLFRIAPSSTAPDFSEGWRRFGVVAADRAMEEPYRRLHRFAPKAMTVLVLGESGCGKEAVARAVHALSPRSSGPFVAVNVSAIPSALIESELFGHARGAFTGADRDRAGLLEEASRGTIFFDEIGDLAPSLQAKLLRALQDREIRRVGENRSRRIDVRVVSATSRDLDREVEAGRFREDLYYRLHVAVIRLPPLRERGRDALLLARHFLSAAAREDGRAGLEIGPDAAAALLAHPWPGNVRELQSAIQSAAAMADGRRLSADLLPEAVRRCLRSGGTARGYRSSVDAHRRDLIREALERSGGNRSRAARELRLSRQALLYLIRELKVTVASAERGVSPAATAVRLGRMRPRPDG